ncbi:TPA: hypothetical protein HA278_07800 [Candidatus Woesearchaeota archaeon]|nr:hypothetical protein [archaeon]HIJ11935.1 hypothetical protein [Candidatus Woesearchaeota archaeon]
MAFVKLDKNGNRTDGKGDPGLTEEKRERNKAFFERYSSNGKPLEMTGGRPNLQAMAVGAANSGFSGPKAESLARRFDREVTRARKMYDVIQERVDALHTTYTNATPRTVRKWHVGRKRGGYRAELSNGIRDLNTAVRKYNGLTRNIREIVTELKGAIHDTKIEYNALAHVCGGDGGIRQGQQGGGSEIYNGYRRKIPVGLHAMGELRVTRSELDSVVDDMFLPTPPRRYERQRAIRNAWAITGPIIPI